MALRGVVLDLDGTVYHGDNVLPGVDDFVETVRGRDCSLCFFSNNPIHDGDDYVQRLQGLGVDARPGEACSSGVVTSEYLHAEHAGDEVFVIGSDAVREQVRDTAAILTDEPAPADVLLASWTDAFHYRDLATALRVVGNDTTFLGTDPDRTFPDENGEPVPGSGAIIRAVAGVLDRDPDRILGKPSEVAVRAALERLGCTASECLVVGDRLDTDIRMGERSGMTTALVTTGVSDREAVEHSDVQPDYVVDSLAAVVPIVEELTAN
ncbi:HAD-IIA family hydrolase [Haloarcula halophila]|uniref:HAD-IIA family hydrolase n=1 Tax=Haloarcula TaxID=2237 RepID=UPI0023E3C934|nr:HAD-IIA family hydrolase [Halomicroarcula sp. DFY41]